MGGLRPPGGIAGAIALLFALACGEGASSPPVGQAAAAVSSTSHVDGMAHDPESSGVTVPGEGRVRVEPDGAQVVVGVEVVRPEVGTAFSEASARARAILDALRAAGVDADDIQTEEISVRPQRERPPDPAEVESRPEITGYVVTNLVEVTVRDLDRAGEILATAVEAGGDAARVQQFRLSVEPDDVHVDEARRAAFADALQRAEQYADAAGRTLGDLRSITEVSGAGPVRGPVPEAAEDAVVAPPVEPGQEEIVVRILATWLLE